jgi:hypothetical protein
MLFQTLTGPSKNSNGTLAGSRGGNSGDVVVSELHGRFYEQNFQGNVYSNGSTVTALTANTISLTATTTPILGIWNPATSTVNAVISQAALTVVANNLTSGAGPGVFVWAVSIGNAAISTGSNPWNRKSLAQNGSQVKGMSFVALTGLTNNLVIMEGSEFATPAGLTYTTLASTQLMPEFSNTQNFDGSLIVPPGGVLALLNTTSSTTFSVSGRLLWEEVGVAGF